jgi:LmbE family N-acetylglucosaminyl deacetylase
MLMATAALAAFTVTAAPAQLTQKQDPANLAATRVKAAVRVDDIAANEGAAALYQSLLKLRTRASLMMIVAHPDDEDSGMMTYEVRGHGAHVAMLTLTRGEGGQNLMSGDFDDNLGLVRTQELLAADRYFGIDQMFGTEVDFGFSKTKEEAFANWGHDRVLYDAVRAVRLYRPLVLASVFIGAPTDGHGQHQVSGEITQEVFDAAGDPKVFPEQIAAGLQPWTPLKVYARVPFAMIDQRGMYDYAIAKYVPARFYNYVTKVWSDTPPKPTLTIHEGDYDPLLGMGYSQFARIGLGLQKSQNGGTGYPTAGVIDSAYTRYGSHIPAADTETSFFDSIDVSFAGIADEAPSMPATFRPMLGKIDMEFAEAQRLFNPGKTELAAPPIREALSAIDSLIKELEDPRIDDLPSAEKYNLLHELYIKRTQANSALVQALGLSLRSEISSGPRPGGLLGAFGNSPDTFTSAIPGQSFAVSFHAVNGSSIPLTVKTTELDSSYGSPMEKAGGTVIKSDAAFDTEMAVKLPSEGNAPTQPLITRTPFVHPGIETPHYDYADPNMRLAPLPVPALTAWVTFDYNGVPIHVGQQVQTAHRVTGQGVVYQPLTVAPAISVAVSPSAGVVPFTEKSLPVSVHVLSNVKGAAKGTVKLELPAGWTATPAAAPFALGKDGDSTDVAFTVTPSKLTSQPYTMTAVAEYAGQQYREGYHTAGYATLLPTDDYKPASYRATGVDVSVAPGLKVAYLPGTGDDVQASLENLGVHATTIGVADIANHRLAGYDAVVLGVRTYSAHPDLAAANAALLDYANSGGVVIVQYQSNPYDHNYGPYPYHLNGDTAEKVVDEHSPVTILEPRNPLLTWPNKITVADFNDWVEERGHGFMQTWDPHYTALVETHDPEQDPQKGGLLFARTGKGAYIYLSFALYRQLPEGVPGPYRIFANLISLAKNPAH